MTSSASPAGPTRSHRRVRDQIERSDQLRFSLDDGSLRGRAFYYGLAIAAALAVGLLILRTAFASGYSLATELFSNRLTYGYVFVATAVVFMWLGYALGRQADELRRLSITDSLTGLANRRAFQGRLREE